MVKLALKLKAIVASLWVTMNNHIVKNEVNIFDNALYKAKRFTK